MSILKLTPSCKDYLWGGSRLRTDFGVQSDLNPLAEAWPPTRKRREQTAKSLKCSLF